MSQPPPPEPPPPAEGFDRPYYGGPFPAPPVSGEFVVFLLVWLVAAIVTLGSDAVGANDFVTASVALAIGYMLARGIAKAGRVLEHR